MRNILDSALGTALTGILFVIAFAYAFGPIINIAFDRWEKHQCFKWQQYEQDYRLFELSESDRSRCESLGVHIGRKVW